MFDNDLFVEWGVVLEDANKWPYADDHELTVLYKTHGADLNAWSLPEGQPLKWKAWAWRLKAETVRRGWFSDFCPWAALDDVFFWCDFWHRGFSPEEAIDFRARA